MPNNTRAPSAQTNKPTPAETASDLIGRIGDCQGAVTLAIESLLAGNGPDNAISSLSLVERELGRLRDEVDRMSLSPALRIVRAGDGE